MLMDARDVVLLAGEEEIMERWESFDHPWVYNAEPFIWSPGSFEPDDYPPCDTLYRYLNAGVAIGEREHIIGWFNSWTLPLYLPTGDQDWMAARYLDSYPAAIKLDSNCELFQCLCGSMVGDDPYVTIERGKVYNRMTDTYPLVIHANGGSDITLPPFDTLWRQDVISNRS